MEKRIKNVTKKSLIGRPGEFVLENLLSAEELPLKVVLEKENSVSAYVDSKFIKFLQETKSGVLTTRFFVSSKIKEDVIKRLISEGFTPFEGVLIKEEKDKWYSVYINSGGEMLGFTVMVAAQKDKLWSILEEFKEKLIKLFGSIINENRVLIYWFFWAVSEIECHSFVVEFKEKFYPEAYPYLNVEGLFDDFIRSEENILILKGAPGTGKTRLIRWMLKYISQFSSSSENMTNEDITEINRNMLPLVFYVRDKQLLSQDAFYLQLLHICSERNLQNNTFLVIEDMDYELSSRKDGNSAMSYLLNLTDGLFPIKLKCIFTTNLPGIHHIDEALLRPGRLYNVVETRPLESDEVRKLVKKISDQYLEINKSMTLAEIYRMVRQIKRKNLEESKDELCLSIK